jgi:UDP-glucose 4-epimerase
LSKAIVTGGAGFIGSHLVERLLREGVEVVVIDNYSTGRPENLLSFEGHKNLTVVEADICDLQTIQPYFSGADYVYHVAALADIVPSMQNPRVYHHSNVTGTVSVLEACRQAQIRKFIYCASSSCYGIPDKYPTDESAEIRPMYPYALTKYLGEEYVLHWSKVFKIPAISLRFFNVYGPRSRTSGTYGAVFGVFLAQKLKGLPFTVVGDGSQTRDFTFVTDIVDAMITAAESPIQRDIFNVGSGATYSVNTLVGLLGGDVTYIPKRPGEPDCTFADICKISSVLNWKPKVALEQGVGEMLRHIDYWRAAPAWTPETIAVATKEWHEYLGKA